MRRPTAARQRSGTLGRSNSPIGVTSGAESAIQRNATTVNPARPFSYAVAHKCDEAQRHERQPR